MSERQDRDATSEARAYVQQLFNEYGVRPNHTLLGCGRTICRLQISFPTVIELRNLSRIPLDGAQIQIGGLEPVIDGVTVVTYWDRNADSPMGDTTHDGGI